MAGKNIKWNLIAGHAGVVGNERCDIIATNFADGIEQNLYKGSLENYPIKNILDLKSDGIPSGKKRSSAKAYSYVSLVDGKISIHKTWLECKTAVEGKSGAKWKKVFSADEEKNCFKSS